MRIAVAFRWANYGANKLGANKQRANKQRANKQRANKQRANKQRGQQVSRQNFRAKTSARGSNRQS